MIKWKKKGTELYQNLPKECRELMKECDPLTKIREKQKRKTKINFSNLEKNKMKNYENYVLGSWIKGDGDFTPLYNAINGDEIGFASSKGLDFNEMMNYARKTGGYKLEK